MSQEWYNRVKKSTEMKFIDDILTKMALYTKISGGNNNKGALWTVASLKSAGALWNFYYSPINFLI